MNLRVIVGEDLIMSRKSHVVDSVKLGVSGGSSGSSTGGPYYGNGAYAEDYENDILEHTGPTKNDTDAMTVHRRKMMRRAANRRSAQLSRARKKVS